MSRRFVHLLDVICIDVLYIISVIQYICIQYTLSLKTVYVMPFSINKNGLWMQLHCLSQLLQVQSNIFRADDAQCDEMTLVSWRHFTAGGIKMAQSSWLSCLVVASCPFRGGYQPKKLNLTASRPTCSIVVPQENYCPSQTGLWVKCKKPVK